MGPSWPFGALLGSPGVKILTFGSENVQNLSKMGPVGLWGPFPLHFFYYPPFSTHFPFPSPLPLPWALSLALGAHPCRPV